MTYNNSGLPLMAFYVRIQYMYKNQCWDTDGWRKPSGITGKNKKAYKGKCGYGYEDWLLDTTKTREIYTHVSNKRRNENPAHKYYIWLLPIRDPDSEKIKKAIFCLHILNYF